MGSVDLCLRVEGDFQRLVAMKRLLPLLRVDETVRSMFLDEARIAGLLRHANVVSVTDVGEDEDGPFLVMDYVEGMSLHAMQRRPRAGVPAAGTDGSGRSGMPAGVAARIVLDCARGLHAAHELRTHDGTWLGLVHRDVSPHNVLVGFDGRVLLTDFGISKAVGQQTRTTTGLLKGKLGYMAPEQLRFEEADRRSDVFALGIVLHELLTGARLFEGEPRVVAQNILNGRIPDLSERPEVPKSLAALTARMLAMRPEDRPPTAEEVATRLDEILRSGDVDPASTNVAEFAAARFGVERDAASARIAELVANVGKATHEADAEPAISIDRSEIAIAEATRAETPAALATARPSWGRRAIPWAIAACFLLTPVVMWAIDAQTRDEVATPTLVPTVAPVPVAPPVVAAPAPVVEPEVVPEPPPQPARVVEPATTPARRPRATPRAHRDDDPMGRWSWE
jgi:serine/threonine protein kinase